MQEAFGLIRWVLSTNRSYLKPLEQDELFTEMETPNQFRLMLSSASHEAK